MSKNELYRSLNPQEISFVETCEALHAQRHYLKLDKIVDQFSRKNAFKPILRFFLSKWYHHSGNSHKAFKILGNEAIFEPEGLLLGLRKSFMLSYFGAFHSAQKILEVLKPFVFKKNQWPLLQFTWQHYSGSLNLRCWRYSQAYQAYCSARTIFQDNPTLLDAYTQAIIEISLCDCLFFQGKFAEALSSLRALKLQFPAKIEYERLLSLSELEYSLFYPQPADLEKLFEIFFEKFKQSPEGKDFALGLSYFALFQFERGQRSLAQELLQKAQSLLQHNWHNPGQLLANIYLNQALGFGRNGSYSECGIFLFHPVQSPWAQKLLGLPIQNDQNLAPFYTHLIEKYSLEQFNTKADSVFLKKEQWEFVHYQEVKVQAEPLVDLIAGLVFEPQEAQAVCLLSEPSRLVLENLARAGQLGLNMWYLIELLYGQDKSFNDSLWRRLERELTVLKNLGLHIKRDALMIYWNLEKNCVVFSKQVGIKAGIHHYLRKHFPQINASELAHFLACSKQTAGKYLQNWTKDEILVKRADGMYQWN